MGKRTTLLDRICYTYRLYNNFLGKDVYTDTGKHFLTCQVNTVKFLKMCSVVSRIEKMFQTLTSISPDG